MLGRIQAGDDRVMQRLNRWPAPRWVQLWMIAAARAGDGWLWWGVGALMLIFGGDKRFPSCIAGLISAGAAQITFKVLKHVTHRERPCATETHCWASLAPPDRFSFPSGHTMSAFAVAIPVGLVYPAMMPALLF